MSFLYLGSNELMWPALQTKKVAATVLQPPWTLLARKSGMNFLVDLSDLKIEYQGSTLASRRSFIRDNPNVTRRVLRAIVRGVHFFYSRKEESLRILAKFLATDNAEALEEGYLYAKFPPKPYATESAVQATLNHLAERDARFALRKPAEFIEPGPLSELDRSGFIDRLYVAQKCSSQRAGEVSPAVNIRISQPPAGDVRDCASLHRSVPPMMRTSSFPRARSAKGLRRGRRNNVDVESDHIAHDRADFVVALVVRAPRFKFPLILAWAISMVQTLLCDEFRLFSALPGLLSQKSALNRTEMRKATCARWPNI